MLPFLNLVFCAIVKILCNVKQTEFLFSFNLSVVEYTIQRRASQ